MVAITTTEIVDKETWENFVLSYQGANFLQSWYWGEFHQTIGHKIYRIGLYRHHQLAGVMLIIVERAKRAVYLTLPAGPLIDWEDRQLVDTFFQSIKNLAREEHAVFVRIRPQLHDNKDSRALFKQHYCLNAPMHLHAELTSQLDITASAEELLTGMRKTTRQTIKKCQQKKIKIISTQDDSFLKDFYETQKQTALRQNFVPFSYKFLSAQFNVFTKHNLVILYKAEYDNQPLAYALIIFYGHEAVYHYGATTDIGKHHPGAYLIQWEAINEAKRRGMKRYNFWGVAPINNPHHRFYNLSIFKRGFGAVDVAYVHAQDLVINYPWYFVNYLVETARKKIRRL